jgi:hypothetical protein
MSLQVTHQYVKSPKEHNKEHNYKDLPVVSDSFIPVGSLHANHWRNVGEQSYKHY